MDPTEFFLYTKTQTALNLPQQQKKAIQVTKLAEKELVMCYSTLVSRRMEGAGRLQK